VIDASDSHPNPPATGTTLPSIKITENSYCLENGASYFACSASESLSLFDLESCLSEMHFVRNRALKSVFSPGASTALSKRSPLIRTQRAQNCSKEIF
jgi:hypothetical protein